VEEEFSQENVIIPTTKIHIATLIITKIFLNVGGGIYSYSYSYSNLPSFLFPLLQNPIFNIHLPAPIK
jgi:hypothetical protein